MSTWVWRLRRLWRRSRFSRHPGPGLIHVPCSGAVRAFRRNRLRQLGVWKVRLTSGHDRGESGSLDGTAVQRPILTFRSPIRYSRAVPVHRPSVIGSASLVSLAMSAPFFRPGSLRGSEGLRRHAQIPGDLETEQSVGSPLMVDETVPSGGQTRSTSSTDRPRSKDLAHPGRTKGYARTNFSRASNAAPRIPASSPRAAVSMRMVPSGSVMA